MPNCYQCKIEIKDIPYRCKFCGMIYCNKHRLPENHNCPFDLINKSNYTNSLDKTHLLYQDALEYINKELTVARIYDYVTSMQITKSKAIDLLSYFLEKSDNSEIRKVSVLAFGVLELKSDKAYTVLESCILSDEDSDVINTGLKIITYNFPKKSKDLLNWISKHDKNLRIKRE